MMPILTKMRQQAFPYSPPPWKFAAANSASAKEEASVPCRNLRKYRGGDQLYGQAKRNRSKVLDSNPKGVRSQLELGGNFERGNFCRWFSLLEPAVKLYLKNWKICELAGQQGLGSPGA